MDLPDCRICKHPVILADAGLLKPITYFYCRRCKIEVDRWGYSATRRTDPTMTELEEHLEQEITKLEPSSPGWGGWQW